VSDNRIIRSPYKITALPLNKPVVKRKAIWQVVSPYLVIVGLILFVSLINGLIGV